ncbi:MAG TPA: twin transmembrane helix small protein [Burkholderiales bacterium]|nr:twin transmembrane helix small protein [Burkholderiales bacterium]
MKAIVILFLILIVGSLGSALYFLVRDRGRGSRTVKALTWRVALSVALFLLLMLGFHFGLITGKIQ